MRIYDRAIRVGVPNRSSFLHIAGISTLIYSGIIPRSAYRPAKLFYDEYGGSGIEVFLMNNSSLCRLALEDKLDVIFTGGDYASEYLDSCFFTEEFSIFSVQFALLRINRAGPSNAEHPISRLYTKFPEVSKRYCVENLSNVPEIVPVPGASETFALMDSESAALDIIYTGETVFDNNMHSTRIGDKIYPGWYARDADLLSDIVSRLYVREIEASVAGYYGTFSASKNKTIIDAVDVVLEITSGAI